MKMKDIKVKNSINTWTRVFQRHQRRREHIWTTDKYKTVVLGEASCLFFTCSRVQMLRFPTVFVEMNATLCWTRTEFLPQQMWSFLLWGPSGELVHAMTWTWRPYPKPSCLQTTSASLSSHWSSQIVPHLPVWNTSTRPSKSSSPPTSLRGGPLPEGRWCHRGQTQPSQEEFLLPADRGQHISRLKTTGMSDHIDLQWSTVINPPRKPPN